MKRNRIITASEETADFIGALVCSAIILVGLALMAIGAGAVAGGEKLSGRGWLRPVIVGTLIGLTLIQIIGCQQPGRGPQLPAPIAIELEQTPARPAGK